MTGDYSDDLDDLCGGLGLRQPWQGAAFSGQVGGGRS